MHFKYAILSLVVSSAGYASAAAIHHRHIENIALASEVCVYTRSSVSLIILFGTNKKRANLTSNLTASEAQFEDQFEARTTSNTANGPSSANNTTAPANTTAAPQDCGFSQDQLEAALGPGPFNLSCGQILSLEDGGFLVGKK